jgi:hypothetical protein
MEVRCIYCPWELILSEPERTTEEKRRKNRRRTNKEKIRNGRGE